MRVRSQPLDGDVDLRDAGIIREQLGRAAATVRIKVDDQDTLRTRVEDPARGEREPLEGAEAVAPGAFRVVETRRERMPVFLPVSSARRAAVTAPPVEAQAIG